MKYYEQDMQHLIHHGYINWNKLRNKTIVITGSTGMIGKAVIDMLIMANELIGLSVMVYALARNEEKAKKIFHKFIDKSCFRIIIGDVCDFSEYPQTDYMLHAASYGDPSSFAKDPVGIMYANLEGTIKILEHTRKNNARMLFVSTGEVYGNMYNTEDEMSKGNTEDMYGLVDFNQVRACYPESKRAAETLCRSYFYQYGTDIVIGRLCHTYGQTMTDRDSRVIAQFFRNVLNKEDIILKSTGKQIRSMCYVVDAVGGILHILLNGEKSESYNIAGPPPELSIFEMAEMLSELFGLDINMHNQKKQENDGLRKVSNLILCNEKLQKLGWIAYTGLRDGMKKTIYDLEESR